MLFTEYNVHCASWGWSESGITAVDEGYAVALSVAGGKVDGVGVVVGGGTVRQRCGGMGWVEEFGALGEVGGRDEFGAGDFFVVGVCYPPVCVGEGDAEGFDSRMKMDCGVVVVYRPSGYFALLFELLKNA